MRPRPTEPIGLYDPAFEHDACGVAFVARLDGVPTHETVARGLRALANLEHRGAAGADANDRRRRRDPRCRCRTGSSARWSATSCRRPAQYGVGVCFLPRDDARRAELERLLETTVEAEGQRVSAGATSRSTTATSATTRERPRAAHARSSSSAPRRARVRPGRLRAQAVRDPPRGRARRRAATSSLPELLLADARLQGDADGAAAPGLLPRSAGRADRERRSCSSTRASRRTRSRAGSSRTRTG